MKKASEKAALVLVSLAAVATVAFVAALMVSERRRTEVIGRVRMPASVTAHEGPATPVPQQNGDKHRTGETVLREATPSASDQDETIEKYKHLFEALDE